MHKFASFYILIGLLIGCMEARAEAPSLIDKEDVDTKQIEATKSKKTDDYSVSEFLGDMFGNFFSSPKIEAGDTVGNLEQKAEDGDVLSQLKLGYSYLYGNDQMKADYKKAFHYYELAAQQNDKIGLNNLGTLYYNGIGTKRDLKKAIQLFKKAADADNYEAATNLGFMYSSGQGIEKNAAIGADYFEKAASGGNILAQYMVGCAYYYGIYRPVDYIKAAQYIKATADKGLDEAQIMIAGMYINGKGLTQNYVHAVNYLQQAVAQGNTEAMLKLADIYSGSIKYPKDILNAHVLYNIASVHGNKEALARREMLEKNLKIDDLLEAQGRADSFRDRPSALSNYVRQTLGGNICSYMR